ncbi:MAG: 3'-5' exonuclease [Oligosphaeraceae bacterium]
MSSTPIFLIADSFRKSLAKLTQNEQRLTKTTTFEFQMNPTGEGMKFHKLDHARDDCFASVRISDDLRLIVHRRPESVLICYVGHHDDAYRWAQNRKLSVHPQTGAAQMLEIREEQQTVSHRHGRPTALPLFRAVTAEELLGYGVPQEWLADVQALTSEDELLELAEHLPQEAAEALLELATGNRPPLPSPATSGNPLTHPDARRRFCLISNQEELEQAFTAPWEKWIVFLHPEQRKLVEKTYNGPARVLGSAGTGKTVVALHRAVFLARHHEQARVLLTTFSRPLANALKQRRNWLVHSSPQLADRIDVRTISDFAKRMYQSRTGQQPPLISEEHLRDILESVAQGQPNTKLILTEWQDIVDARQLRTWEDYRTAPRLGRRLRLTESRRKELWQLFDEVQRRLKQEGLLTMAGLYAWLEAAIRQDGKPPYDFIIADEAQDISIPELKFLAAIANNRPNSLFFTGDNGQRIFQTPFSWKQLGISIQGRSFCLGINYRTSQQIRQQADRLLPEQVADADGNSDNRRKTISIFNGPSPEIKLYSDESAEQLGVAQAIRRFLEEGIQPGQIGVFVRTPQEFPRAQAAIRKANQTYEQLDDDMQTDAGHIAIGTMHQAKGLEYRAVVVMACDEDILPSLERINDAAEPSDQQEVFSSERQLLYVACTRAREQLLVTGITPGSEFLEDMS